jgi:hypothetical protein
MTQGAFEVRRSVAALLSAAVLVLGAILALGVACSSSEPLRLGWPLGQATV